MHNYFTIYAEVKTTLVEGAPGCCLDASHWEIIYDKELQEPNATMVAATSIDDCQNLCKNEPSCRSVNHYADTQECGLNTKAWGDESALTLYLAPATSKQVDYSFYCPRPGR